MKLFVCAIVMASFLSGCGAKEPPVSIATKKFVEAKELAAKGQKTEALAALDASIADKPSLWALRERAKLHAERGEDKAARDDCEAAIKIMADDADVLWIMGELAKPVALRFQGNAKSPPSNKH